MEATDDVDVTTTLRSEVAALQYKRDRLTSELEDMRSQLRTRDQRCLDLQVTKFSDARRKLEVNADDL